MRRYIGRQLLWIAGGGFIGAAVSLLDDHHTMWSTSALVIGIASMIYGAKSP